MKKFASLALASGLCAGCYSPKMMEFTYQELDTVKTQQRELLERIDQLSQRFDEEREARLTAQAEQSLTMQELRDLVEVLSTRVDDTSQLLSSNRRAGSTVQRRQSRPDAQRVDAQRADTSRYTLPDSADMMPASDDSDAEKLFKSSYMDLTLGNYDLAVQGFKNYLVRYPNADDLANAHYYLGEAYYSSARYLEAVAEYQTIIKESSRSRFAPAAYLKSGFCYQKLGESRLAERSFRELISLYPRTEEAEQARVEIQDLGG